MCFPTKAFSLVFSHTKNFSKQKLLEIVQNGAVVLLLNRVDEKHSSGRDPFPVIHMP